MRALNMDAELPTSKQDVPYPEHEKIVRGYGKHLTEMFAGTITGAGGVGGTLDVPFDVAYVEITNLAGTPRIRKLFVGGAVQVDATGAVAVGLSVANDAAGKPRRVTAAVAIAANAEVVQVLAYGFRDVGGGK